MAFSNGKIRPRAIIIGGGFGGMYAARKLGGADIDVTLIDRRNFHLFQPLLYQVATGGLSPGDISAPLRGIVSRYPNVRVLHEEVVDVDLSRREVVLVDGALKYDYLIVATGSTHHYFGQDQYEAMAPGLKTVEDALEIRRRIFAAFEAAEKTEDPQEIDRLMTFVIAGGGPTGVELAGAICEIAFHTLRKDFRRIDPSKARVMLIEGLDRVLSTFPEKVSRRAEDQLRETGVEVVTGCLVTEVSPDHVVITDKDKNERKVETRTVLWAAGVKATDMSTILAGEDSELLDKMNRLKVESDLSLPGHPEVFVVGDLAHFPHQTGKPLPALAPVAMQQGKYAAKVIRKRSGNPDYQPGPFRYWDRGNLATIGRAAAVGTIWRLKFSGWLAWIAWLFVHLMYLVEFDNRLVVLIQWAWNYITRSRGARLITRTGWRPHTGKNAERVPVGQLAEQARRAESSG